MDAQGVAFAAIQGLQERLAAKESELERRFAEKDAQIAALMAQNAELTAHLAVLSRRAPAALRPPRAPLADSSAVIRGW